MSYIRAGWPMRYVKGDSRDYVFSDGEEITDYGGLTNEGFVEIFARHFNVKDKELRDYMLKTLAKKLNVKLRDKPLSWSQILKRMEQNVKKIEN